MARNVLLIMVVVVSLMCCAPEPSLGEKIATVSWGDTYGTVVSKIGDEGMLLYSDYSETTYVWLYPNDRRWGYTVRFINGYAVSISQYHNGYSAGSGGNNNLRVPLHAPNGQNITGGMGRL